MIFNTDFMRDSPFSEHISLVETDARKTPQIQRYHTARKNIFNERLN